MYLTLGGVFCSFLLLVQTGFLSTFYGALQLCLVLQFTYFLFFVRGLKRMVDFLTNRSFETYTQYSPVTNHEKETLSSLATLKRFSQDQRYRKILSREADANARDRQLLHIKESTPEVHVSERRPFMGLCCQNCTLTSRDSLVKRTTENLALINILNYQTPLASRGILSRVFSHLYQVSVLKKYSYPQIADLVLKDDRVKTAVEKAALQQFKDSDSTEDEYYQELIQKNQARAKKLTFDMRSTLSDFLLRFTSWILYKLLPCFLTSVVVPPGQVEMLKEASKTNLPLIFLPLHRSHLDYILLSFILLNNNIRSPLVAAGDNLKIPFFGSLLRALGAFFIKRRIDPVMGRKDYVYKAVLHTYMNLCLRAGHNIEFFLEGGRTRTGKPCMPKYGVLSVIVETFMDGTIEDALLVPVSINYEKLIDGNFVKEQLGQPKKMETFGNAFKGIWHVLNSNYGMMRVDFNQPFSLRELINTFNSNTRMLTPNVKSRVLKSNPSTNSLYGTDVVSDEHKSLVENISKHVIFDCAQATSVMSTNALAFLLLTKFRNGAKLETLVAALEDLKRDFLAANKDVGFSGDSVDVINYAVHLLGPALVRKEKINGEDTIKPIAILPNVIELSYYSNSVVTHYALESVIALAITRSLSTGCTVMTHDNLLENATELCSIFQYEFLFNKPCQNLEQILTCCIDDLSVKGVFLAEPESNELVRKSRKIAEQFDDEDEQVLQKQYEINPDQIETVEFLSNILMPILETYAITGHVMNRLIQKQLLENELVEEVMEELKFQLGEGYIMYDEAVSVDSIKNAFKLYQKWGLLECQQEFKLRLYSLKESYDNAESVKLFHDKVNKYRINQGTTS